MKIIITESQNKSLKNKLTQLVDKSGFLAGVSAVGGLENFVKIMYDGAYSKFITLVVNELIENTGLRGHHYYLFNCNISVMLNHANPRKPFFAGSPSCFDDIMESSFNFVKVNYELEKRITKLIWGAYSEFIIDEYLKNKGY